MKKILMLALLGLSFVSCSNTGENFMSSENEKNNVSAETTVIEVTETNVSNIEDTKTFVKAGNIDLGSGPKRIAAYNVLNTYGEKNKGMFCSYNDQIYFQSVDVYGTYYRGWIYNSTPQIGKNIISISYDPYTSRLYAITSDNVLQYKTDNTNNWILITTLQVMFDQSIVDFNVSNNNFVVIGNKGRENTLYSYSLSQNKLTPFCDYRTLSTDEGLSITNTVGGCFLTLYSHGESVKSTVWDDNLPISGYFAKFIGNGSIVNVKDIAKGNSIRDNQTFYVVSQDGRTMFKANNIHKLTN